MGGIQTSELLICCGFFLIYLLEELMHYLIAIREMKNNSELVLHHALTKCNPVIFWKKNRNLNNCDYENTETNKRNDERHDFLDSYECHFGFDPEVITMDEFTNNYRRDSLPMECPLSSISSSNYGDIQPQSTISAHSMSYVHLRGVEEYSINHPLSGSSTTLLMETSSVNASPLPPPIPPPPPQIDFETTYLPNNIKNYIDNNEVKQHRPNKCVTFSIDQDPTYKDHRKNKSENNHKFINIPFQFNNNDNNNYSNLQTILRGLVAIFALSIHSLFEGLAVGLEKNISSIWYLFLAIGTHKFVIIFCVGIELVAAKLKPLWITIYIIGFAMVTPFGIFIGSIISHSYGTTNQNEIFNNTEITSEGVLLTVAAMLQAISAGTLLYVIFFEILVKQRDHHHHIENITDSKRYTRNDNMIGHLHHSAESLIQCFAVGCGFMFMVIIHALLSRSPHHHVH